MHKLTGDVMTSSDIGQRKKLGIVMHRSSLTMVIFDPFGHRESERKAKERLMLT